MAGGLSRARRLLLGRRGDVLAASAAAVLLVVCAVAFPSSGPLPFSLVVALTSSVPLAWRRVAPLPVLVLGVCPLAAQALLAGPETSNIGQFVVLLVLMFSFGAYASRRELPAGLVLALTAVYLVQLDDPTNSSTLELLLSPPTLVFLPLAAGRLLQRQTATARRLRRITVQLDRQRESDARAAMLAERARIAREVHDVVAHSVGVMVVQAGAAEELATVDPLAAQQAMAAVRTTGRDALGELRRLLGLLTTDADEAVLAPQPGLAQLDTLIEQFRSTGVEVQVAVSGDRTQLPAGVDLAAYRIIQEGLTNVRKHGGPTARLALDRRTTGVAIEICDEPRQVVPAPARADRLGFDGAEDDQPPDIELMDGGARPRGHGLVGMRERVALYGGTLTVGPTSGGGWQVRAWLPNDSDTDARA